MPSRQDTDRSKMKTFHACLIHLSLLTCLSLIWEPIGVDCASSVADSYPVMIEDGDNSFLILNDDEVSSSQFMKQFSGASKEEVEELVDSSPIMQDMILDRIKVAVEKRKKKNKAQMKKPAELERPPASAKIVDVEQPLEHIIHIVHDRGDGSAYAGEEEGTEEEEGEEEEGMDDKKVAKMRAKLKTKAAKVFKIGAKMKEKLMKFVRKKDKKKAKKAQNGRFPRPHFHYKVTSITDE